MNIGFKKLHKDAIVPSFGNEDILNAGLDFYSINHYTIKSGESAIMCTGIAWDGLGAVTETEKPVLKVFSRSGLAFNSGIECTNAGVIDASYQGEIKIKLYNTSKKDYCINKGDRIAQGIVSMLPIFTAVEITNFSKITNRGGFGSTGV